jgi:hypothetical protein
LGNWYCNIIRIDRKKCLLFTNEKTLYSFLLPNVLKKNITNIAEEFLINLSFNLQAEGFGLEVIRTVMQEYKGIGLDPEVRRTWIYYQNRMGVGEKTSCRSVIVLAGWSRRLLRLYRLKVLPVALLCPLWYHILLSLFVDSPLSLSASG